MCFIEETRRIKIEKYKLDKSNSPSSEFKVYTIRGKYSIKICFGWNIIFNKHRKISLATTILDEQD